MSTSLSNVDLGDVNHRVFGDSPASLGCAGDAAKARNKVVESLNDMSAGLLGYRTGLNEMRRRAHAADDVSHVDLKRTLDAVDACNNPTIASPSTCTLPAPNQGGGR